MNIYFATSVRGDRSNLENNKTIVEILEKHGRVLTKHLVLDDVEGFEKKMNDNIYERDMAWLNTADCLVAEISQMSFGAGYETAHALELLQIPALALYNVDEKKVSGMAMHNTSPLFEKKHYDGRLDLENIIGTFMRKTEMEMPLRTIAKETGQSGKIIVIDGGDGAGKTVQTELLLKQLNLFKQKYGFEFDCRTISFPMYEDSIGGKICGMYLSGKLGEAIPLNPYLSALPYSIDRHSAKEELWRCREKGTIGILNRYTTSNLAYHGAKLQDRESQDEFIRTIEQLEYGQFGLPKPDIVVYLKVPVALSKKLNLLKAERAYLGKEKLDEHEKNSEYQQQVVSLYERLCSERSAEGWMLVDCKRPFLSDSNTAQLVENIQSEADISKILLPPAEIHHLIINAIAGYYQKI